MLTIASAYTLIGLVFGMAFAARGYAALQPAAHGAPLLFRLMLIPGSLLLWPYLLVRWIRSGK